MITFLEGTLEEKGPDRVVLNVGGVGYEVGIPTSSFDGLPMEGERTRLLTVELIREDAHDLVGFRTEEERRMFGLLTSISGVGPKLGLSVLSGIHLRDLKAAAAENDVKRLAQIPGVGKKTAERIALELRGKLSKGELAAAALVGGGDAEAGGDARLRDVYAALVQLGRKPAEAQEAIRKAAGKIGPKAMVDEILRNVLSGRW